MEQPNIDTRSGYRRAKEYRRTRITVGNGLRDVLLISLGVFAASFGLKGFIIPNGFIDGGATGIALLLSQLAGIELHWLLLLVNLPFIFLGYRVGGKAFAIKTGLAIMALAIVTGWIQFPVVTDDKLLTAAFGGFFLGAGIGLAVRGGCVIDGTEVLALHLGRRLSLTMGDVITLLNVVIFSIAALELSINVAMYSMITYLAASRTVDFIIEGIEEYMGVTIISSHHQEMLEMISQQLGRGVTIYQGKRGQGKNGMQPTEIIYTVITRLEMSKLYTEVHKIDPHAFVVTSSVKDTRGGLIRKRRLKH